jgi:nucleoside-diphosphate-sugar epimerase
VNDLRTKRVLITGANGFIGGRCAERLANDEGAIVRGLVRAPRVGATLVVAREGRPQESPLQTIIGDVTDADAVRRAVADCDVVIHCAAMQAGRVKLDEYRRVNVGGTLNVLRAARDAKVQRFIHLSTINVHGLPPPQTANADSPLNFAGDFYSVSKAEGERAAWQFARENKIALTVIRPGCTFGPRSQAWTLTPLNRLRRGRPVLIDGGNGICNAIYIDNLIDLILLALKNDAAVGQAFIGAEGRGVTWREFYDAYAKMLGIEKINSMPRWFPLSVATVFELLAKLDGFPPRIARSSVEFYSHRVVFDIEKSKRLLGYEPKISFEEGMRRTEMWLRSEKIL